MLFVIMLIPLHFLCEGGNTDVARQDSATDSQGVYRLCHFKIVYNVVSDNL